MSYIAKFDSTVAGIPCQIGVMRYSHSPGNYYADSDWDYYGYTESEWEVLDRRGRRAEWLERKMTDSIRDDIEIEVSEWMKELAND
jgi:hypothetical protein